MYDLQTALDAETFASLDGLARQTPDPDLALERLDYFVHSSEAARAQVSGSRRALQAALVVFANSDFLHDTLVREPELLGWALDSERFYSLFTAAELRSQLGSSDTGAPDEGFAAKLAHF
nr:hypothetical protein [Bryobacterales bacterium]